MDIHHRLVLPVIQSVVLRVLILLYGPIYSHAVISDASNMLVRTVQAMEINSNMLLH